MNSKELIKKRYVECLRENPSLFIGVELEFPIVHLGHQATNPQVSKALMSELIERAGFQALKLDEEGYPIALAHDNGDSILFEVSYNTLEFAFAKAEKIGEVEQRFRDYLALIQPFLRSHRHELQGVGIHPNWHINDNSPVKTARYRMLSEFLKLSKDYEQCHSFPEYGAFICGNQVQFDLDRRDLVRVLNAFNKIEAVKAYLFAHSELESVLPDYAITRDYFWEDSMHGIFPENIGVYHKEFVSEEDYIDYMAQSAMFSVEREGGYHFFHPVRVADYFQASELVCASSGERLLPQESDIAYHRSYHYQELTARGTVEFRSICTQPLARTFAPIAFHLGLMVNLAAFEELLAQTDFFNQFGTDYGQLRQRFARKRLSERERLAIGQLSSALLECSLIGLKERGFGEEQYLSGLMVDR